MEKGAVPPGTERLSDIAYRRFKEALFSRQIHAGSVMSQAEIMQITGVSVSPLREAMQVLQSEGLIRILPRSGIQIAKSDLTLVRNAYQLRRVLEVPAVRYAAEIMPKAQIKTMMREHQSLLTLKFADEITDQFEHDIQAMDHHMHWSFIQLLDNPLIERAYRQALDCICLVRLQKMFPATRSRTTLVMQEHLAILEACLARDPNGAEVALQRHFAQTMQRSIGL
jgi:DNA-binding GntR family transcriptional regulator